MIRLRLYLLLLRFFFNDTPDTVIYFFFNDTATTEIYTLSLHDALPISAPTFAAAGIDKADLADALAAYAKRARVKK